MAARCASNGSLGESRSGVPREQREATQEEATRSIKKATNIEKTTSKESCEPHQEFLHYAFVIARRCEECTVAARSTMRCDREMRAITKMANHGWEANCK